LPALRDRVDKERVIHHALAVETGNARPAAIEMDALQRLLAYPWPGNIRELRSVIERAVVLCDTNSLMPLHLPEQRMRAHFVRRDRMANGDAVAPPVPRPLSAREQERREELVRLLREHRGNVAAVGRALQKARFQVHRWLKRYGIDAESFR
jgi:transcriptional regulator of acetoin/glycerol metabolism